MTAQPITDAQGDVGIGTNSPDPSALLDLNSTSKGLLIPRMTTTMRDAITSPATGLMIFNTGPSEFQYNFGTPSAPLWTRIITDETLESNVWMLEGNTGTTPFDGVAGDFLGTADDVDFVIATGSTEQGRFYSPTNGGGFGLAGPLVLNGTTGDAGQVLVSQGTGAAPEWSGALSLDSLAVDQDLTVGGDLTVNGNTIFNGAVEFGTLPDIPLAEGSLLVGDASGDAAPFPAGASGEVLQIDGSGNPSWQTVNLLPAGTGTNTLLVWNGTAWVENTNVTSDPSTGNTVIGGDLTVNGGVTLPPGSVDNTELANSTINVSYGTGLSGDASVALGGTLNLQNTGVTSITGTPDQVNVSGGGTGAVTLSLPQDIDPDATPTFDGVILDALSGGSTATEVVTSNGGTLETRSITSLIGDATLTEGSLWVGDASNNPAELAAGASGEVLQIDGSGNPSWQPVNLLPDGSTPNTILVWNGTTWVENTNVTSDPATGNTVIGGDLTVNGNTIFNGTVEFSTLPDIPLAEGSLLVGDASGDAASFPAGASGEVLRIDGTGNPSWQTVNLLPDGSTPNTILVWNGTAWVENANVTSDPSTGNTVIGGDLTVNGGVTLPPGSVDNTELANSTINVSYGTGLSGDASVALGGTLNLQNTGVTSITGTPDQVNVSGGGTGAVTLSLPQDIDPDATPTFDGVILDALSGGSTATEVVTSNGGTLETRSIASLIGDATLTEGSLWVGDASNNPAELAAGADGQVLTITGGVPTWGAATPASTDVTTASTTDEAFAIRGTASGGTANQVAGVWGRATDPSAGNTGTIGVFAVGNGNTAAGQTNAALQLNDGELRMGRTTETGTGYTVVEGGGAGTAYTAEGPSGVIEFSLSLANSSPLAGALVGVLNTLGTPLGAPTLGTTINGLLGASVFNTTITINNRYVSPESIVLTQVLAVDDTDLLTDLITLFQNGTLTASSAVTNRQAGSFDYTIDLRALGAVPAISSGTIRVGYVVINPGR